LISNFSTLNVWARTMSGAARVATVRMVIAVRMCLVIRSSGAPSSSFEHDEETICFVSQRSAVHLLFI
jgi:hypothetical protein